ncbi:MAG: hypothetical protein E7305_00380 [Butyrivibrio sp.]|nr:hypothetical protein [Butyrivibrio sp.]
MISSREISVVIQGKVDQKNINRLIHSIREKLPEAELIVATWKNDNLNFYIDCDQLVLLKDPGAASMSVDGTGAYNINRLLYSTVEGINRANRKYILKIRSDLLLKDVGFLKNFDSYNKRDISHSLARHKIAICSLYCMKCESEKGFVHPTPYHISDWACFGLSDDIKDLFDIPLVNIEYFARYFEVNLKYRNYSIPWLNHRLWKFPPEQYIGVQYAKKLYPELKFDNCLEYDYVDAIQSEKFIVNNFIILDPLQFGLISEKKYYDKISRHIDRVPEYVWNGLYRNYIYKQDYKKYLDSNYKIGIDWIEKKRRIRRLIIKILKPQTIRKPFILQDIIYTNNSSQGDIDNGKRIR